MGAFKGFDDWIEIFRGGRQVDSRGAAREWSAQDLDSVIRNHSAEHPAPVVVGHPTHDAPAYGWVEGLKRDGNVLLAKFGQVEPAFGALVEQGRFRNRSIALDPAGDGWRLRHVGFLGGSAPAIDGLKPVQFGGLPAAHEFVLEPWQHAGAWRSLAQALRNLRDFLIEKYGIEAADRYAPEYPIDNLTAMANDVGAQPPAVRAFAAPGAPAMSGSQSQSQTFTQADIDAAVATARETVQAEFTRQQQATQQALDAERRTRLGAEFTAAIRAVIDAGRLTPAQAEGAVEFMLALPDGEAERFTFARGTGEQAQTEQVSPRAWFTAFLGRLGKQVPVGEETDAGRALPAGAGATFAAPAGLTVSPDRLAVHQKALQYQKDHPGTEYLAAVAAVNG